MLNGMCRICLIYDIALVLSQIFIRISNLIDGKIKDLTRSYISFYGIGFYFYRNHSGYQFSLVLIYNFVTYNERTCATWTSDDPVFFNKNLMLLRNPTGDISPLILKSALVRTRLAVVNVESKRAISNEVRVKEARISNGTTIYLRRAVSRSKSVRQLRFETYN